MEHTFYDRVMSHDKFYSLLYSPGRIDEKPIKDQIIDIETKEIDWNEKRDKFYWIWGGPGPDFNIYTEDTYGKGWAFTEEEILAAWGEEGKQDG